MPDITDLFRETQRVANKPPLHEAVVAKGANDLTDDVEVTIPSFDGGRQRWPVDTWMPRGTDLPARGTRGVVGQTSAGRFHLLSWK